MSTPHGKRLAKLEASASEGRMQVLADLYESRLGRLPVWLHELDLERIIPLLECCIRIGMLLPIDDALEADEEERRARAQKGMPASKNNTASSSIVHILWVDFMRMHSGNVSTLPAG